MRWTPPLWNGLKILIHILARFLTAVGLGITRPNLGANWSSSLTSSPLRKGYAYSPTSCSQSFGHIPTNGIYWHVARSPYDGCGPLPSGWGSFTNSKGLFGAFASQALNKFRIFCEDSLAEWHQLQTTLVQHDPTSFYDGQIWFLLFFTHNLA